MSQRMYIDLRIISAEDLVAKDRNGKSDPYVVATLGKSKQKTRVIKKSLNPTWNEQKNFEVHDPKTEKIQIQVFDHDLIGRHDFMGEVLLPLNNLQKGVEKLGWYKLEKTEKGRIQLGIKTMTFGDVGAKPSPSPAPALDSNHVPSHQTPTSYPQSYTYPPQQIHPTQQVPPQANSYGLTNSANMPNYQHQSALYSVPAQTSPIEPQPFYSAQPTPSSLYGTPSTSESPLYSQSNVQPYSAPQPQSAPATPTVAHKPVSKAAVSESALREGFSIHYDEIRFDKKIGVGGFGEVWKAEWAGTLVAVKKILSPDISEQDLAEFSTEILLMSKLRHPNIVQFLGACLEPEFCLLAEFMERGSLFDVLAKEPNLDWQHKLNFCMDIAKGMLYLHTRKPPIIHRDIKSLNILVTKEWKCTISDFGLTRIKDKAMLSTKCGSPAWTAPEILRGEQYNESVDVYSYGVVMWEIISGQPPYKGMNPMQVIGQVAYQTPGLRPPKPNCPYPQLIEIMCRCWADNPRARPSFQMTLDLLRAVSI